MTSRTAVATTLSHAGQPWVSTGTNNLSGASAVLRFEDKAVCSWPWIQRNSCVSLWLAANGSPVSETNRFLRSINF